MHLLNYTLFRILTTPLSFLPYACLARLGIALGTLLFYTYPRYRKRALSNIALSGLAVDPRPLAKKSLQNLCVTALELPRLYREKEIHHLAICENPHVVPPNTGVIFFCGHQANWEVFFLEGTSRMSGVAIGRPIKNPYLYAWVLRLREKFGGKIVEPKNGLKQGLKALKQKQFFGIVGDQGMPDSGFCSPFLGRSAWTSPLPALLSLRTGCPIVVATNTRKNDKYHIHYSDPIYPTEQDSTLSLMQKVLSLFEASVRKHPEEWLWIHNRWKQQVPGRLPKLLRQDAIAVIEGKQFEAQFKSLYPTEELCFLSQEEAKKPDYRFKLVFDLTSSRHVRRHFRSLSAFAVLNREQTLEVLHTYAC